MTLKLHTYVPKEIQKVVRLFLVIAMYCQASSSQFLQSLPVLASFFSITTKYFNFLVQCTYHKKLEQLSPIIYPSPAILFVLHETSYSCLQNYVMTGLLIVMDSISLYL